MSISEERRQKLFALLDDLGARDQGELEDEFSKCDPSAINDLMAELLDHDKVKSFEAPDAFADLIYELREQKRNWSRQLGKLLISVEELTDRNEKQTAKQEIESFISACSAPFYKEIALNEKSKLE